MRAFALLVLAVACGEEEPEVHYPDITGRYQFTLGGSAGCDGRGELLDDWASGPLAVSGDPLKLLFDFGDAMAFTGSVTELDSFRFDGSADLGGVFYSVSAGGSAILELTAYTLAGHIEAVVDEDGVDTNDCTIEGPFEAYQVGT